MSAEPKTVPSPFGDPTRRTYLAAERTLLAWWRTAFAAFALAVAIGKLLPDAADLPRVPYLVLGGGWLVLATALIIFGSRRQRLGRAAIEEGGFLYLDDLATRCFGGYALALMVATAVVICTVN